MQQSHIWVCISNNLKQGLKYLRTHAHHSIIYNSQMSVNEWIIENVAFTCNGILFSL